MVDEGKETQQKGKEKGKSKQTEKEKEEEEKSLRESRTVKVVDKEDGKVLHDEEPVDEDEWKPPTKKIPVLWAFFPSRST